MVSLMFAACVPCVKLTVVTCGVPDVYSLCTVCDVTSSDVWCQLQHVCFSSEHLPPVLERGHSVGPVHTLSVICGVIVSVQCTRSALFVRP